MDKNLTEIIVISDRSSSMREVRDEAISGFNTFLKEQQEADIGRCLLTYCHFNTEYEIVHAGIPIEDMKPLDHSTYQPAGMTALFDAVGRTIDEVGARLAKTREDKRPGAVIVVILTDGEENTSSGEYKNGRLEKMIKTQADDFQWSFIFLGKGLDAFQGGAKMGVDMQHRQMFVGLVGDAPQSQRHAYYAASAAVLGTRSRAVGGQSLAFSADEKAAYTSALSGDVDDAEALKDGDSSTPDSSGA